MSNVPPCEYNNTCSWELRSFTTTFNGSRIIGDDIDSLLRNSLTLIFLALYTLNSSTYSYVSMVISNNFGTSWSTSSNIQSLNNSYINGIPSYIACSGTGIKILKSSFEYIINICLGQHMMLYLNNPNTGGIYVSNDYGAKWFTPVSLLEISGCPIGECYSNVIFISESGKYMTFFGNPNSYMSSSYGLNW